MDIYELLPKDKHDVSTMKQLALLSDAEIKQIMPELLTWLQDINWPVASQIIRLIARRQEAVEPFLLEILKSEDEIWKYNILSFLLSKWNTYPGKALLSEINRIALYPTDTEIDEEVCAAAKELLETFNFKAL